MAQMKTLYQALTEAQPRDFLANAHGRVAHSHDVKAMMGIKGKLPAQGMEVKEVQGYLLYCLSLEEAAMHKVTHRMRCICQECGMDMSAGRIAQHKCKPAGITLVAQEDAFLEQIWAEVRAQLSAK